MDRPLIRKRILNAGTHLVPFTIGTKVKFHFCTKKYDGTVVDDSRKFKKPMEMIIGKKFKLAAWEAALQTMAVNEVSSFTVDKSLLQTYPFVAKTLRDAQNPNTVPRSHRCTAALQQHGVGYDDLNLLIKDPCDLEFVFELIKAELPETYEREYWQMDDNEKLRIIPELKNEGNRLYRNKEYKKALQKYSSALGLLEQLMLREKPREKEWIELNEMKMLILLNYAQCKLIEKDFYAVIRHCTTIIDSQVDNVKAFYRRGKANVGVWNLEEAELDFMKVAQLDPSLTDLIAKELKGIEDMRKQKNEEDKKKYGGAISTSKTA